MYLTKKDLAAEYHVSVKPVDRQLELLRDNIGKRYPRGCVIDRVRIIRIRDDVFHDSMVNGDLIERNLAPKFEPREVHVYA